jgi:predicted RNA-binding Zn-ribbon protein involved in translation (DUF1610 family)
VVEARYFCPDCGSIDLQIFNAELCDDEGKSLGRAECPNCAWKGPLTATIGAMTTERMWDANRVGDLMLRVMAVHAAGPLVQALEFVGLLPRQRLLPMPPPPGSSPEEQVKYESDLAIYNDPSTMRWNRAAQEARDSVMRKIMEGAITAGFEEAERVNRLFAIATETDIHPMLKDDEESIREFGGDVGEKKITDIKKARQKKRRR